MSEPDLPRWMYLLGKWGDSSVGHPLIYHLIDSAAVAQVIWQQALSQGARQQFSHWIGLNEFDSVKILMFWTSLHDLGKATNSFQIKTPAKEKLLTLGFQFSELPKDDIRHHSLLSQVILCDFQQELEITPRSYFNQFRYAIGGHHGSFHIQDDLSPVTSAILMKNLGSGEEWSQAQREIFVILKKLFLPPKPQLSLPSQADQNAFFNLLTGFFVISDWLSSQDDPFTYHPTIISPTEYLQEISVKKLAYLAARRAGWLGWQADGSIRSFSDLFAPYQALPLQKKIIDQASNLTAPFLMIIEAPTGCGKTEAALMAADRAIQNGMLKGSYIAMPTQATSNQMFKRVEEFLQKRYSNQEINLHLVHGNALLNKDFLAIRFKDIHDTEERGQIDEGRLNAMDWFLPRKRSLLAAFGVGTVDQTFYSILRARYSILRMFGLFNKVVIFDEVHAYDTYMLEIFIELLGWLRAAGSSVILLSATLPDKTRLNLLRAFNREATVASESAPYPRLSMNDGKYIRTLPLGDFPDRKIGLVRLARDPQAWLSVIERSLAQGGCLAIICNTVERSQQVFQIIRDSQIVDGEDLFLLHARMPFCWRKEREDIILARFGKLKSTKDHPRRGIVVATQIIEQSLDLDFDLLISDLAPVDLLIQRIGRLHRHSNAKFPPLRPDSLSTPCCWLCEPEEPQEDGLAFFEKDRWVYDEVILQRTYFVLIGQNQLRLPVESDRLINQVYSDDPLPGCSPEQNEKLHELYSTMKKKQKESMTRADSRLIGNVDDSSALGMNKDYLPEDDGQVREDLRTLTRDDVLPSVQLICATRKNGKLYLVNGDFLINKNEALSAEALEHAQRSMVNVSKSEVVRFFAQQPVNPAWKKQPLLRRAHLAAFIEGRIELDNGKILFLDDDLGLVVQ